MRIGAHVHSREEPMRNGIIVGGPIMNRGDWWVRWQDNSTVEHHYLSTACHHDRHDECRRQCKFCSAQCSCECHQTIVAAYNVDLVLGWV